MSQSVLVDQVGLVAVPVLAVLVDYQTVRVALVGCYFVFVGQVSYCYFQLELIDRSTNLVDLLVVSFDLVVDLAVVVGCFGYSVGFVGCFDQADRVDCYCCLVGLAGLVVQVGLVVQGHMIFLHYSCIAL